MSTVLLKKILNASFVCSFTSCKLRWTVTVSLLQLVLQVFVHTNMIMMIVVMCVVVCVNFMHFLIFFLFSIVVFDMKLPFWNWFLQAFKCTKPWSFRGRCPWTPARGSGGFLVQRSIQGCATEMGLKISLLV